MAKYLISFPSSAMNLSDEELAAASEDSHAVVSEAKAAGVWVFGGGIEVDRAKEGDGRDEALAVCDRDQDARGIERAVRAERRHHGSQHGAQTCADIHSAGAHGDLDYPRPSGLRSQW